jgi:hypothetical protein
MNVLAPLTISPLAKVALVGVILAGASIAGQIMGKHQNPPVAVTPPRPCPSCPACPAPPVPTLLDNAALAARRDVWEAVRFQVHNEWALDNRLNVVCGNVVDGGASCLVNGPAHPSTMLHCHTGAYPFNEGCVWTDEDDFHRRYWLQ